LSTWHLDLDFLSCNNPNPICLNSLTILQTVLHIEI
jgi:hypothetical protein